MTKVAAIQMTSQKNVEHNLKRAESLLNEAVNSGAALAVLPEMFVLQSPEATDKIAIAEPFGMGSIQTFLSEQSIKNNLWIIAGTIPIQSPHSNKPFSATLVFNAQGECVAHYNKMHLFDVSINTSEQYHESYTTTPGEQVSFIDTPAGKIGLAVCYDLRFPELFRCLFNQGAEIFAIPCAFTEKTGQAHFEVLLRARAIENFSYVVAACQTGEHGNHRTTYGYSMIIDPWGEVLAVLPKEEGVITADINLAHLHQIRANIPVKDHQQMRLTHWIKT